MRKIHASLKENADPIAIFSEFRIVFPYFAALFRSSFHSGSHNRFPRLAYTSPIFMKTDADMYKYPRVTHSVNTPASFRKN